MNFNGEHRTELHGIFGNHSKREQNKRQWHASEF